jgi:hypothetical protein
MSHKYVAEKTRICAPLARLARMESFYQAHPGAEGPLDSINYGDIPSSPF